MRKQHIFTLALAVVVGLGALLHRPAAHHRAGAAASPHVRATAVTRDGGAMTEVSAAPFVRPRAADPPDPEAVAVAVAVAPTPAFDPWAALRWCESGDQYAADTGNGYYGAYQFTAGTWASLGFAGLPSQASPALQDLAARDLESARGWSQWPACARELGLA